MSTPSLTLHPPTAVLTINPPRRPRKLEGPWQMALRRFKRHRLATLGFGLLVVMALLAIAAPLVAGYDPSRNDLLSINRPPSAAHVFGTDGGGRDIWARLVYGTRISLSVGIVAVAISTALGTLVGSLAGFYRGWVDLLVMRLTDVVMSFPPLLVIISIVAIVGPNIYNIMAVIGLLSWPATCRLVRAEFFSLRERPFVEAARCIGTPDYVIVLRHILPNALGPVVVATTFGVSSAILAEAALSFLGLGVQVPTPSWGSMLQAASSQTALAERPWQWLPPGLAIVTAALSINFAGEGLRDALDPHTRVGHSSTP